MIPVIHSAADWAAVNEVPADGLQQVFQHLWTRLHEAETAATVLAQCTSGSEDFDQTLRALLQVANVQGTYEHMVDLLRAAKAGAEAREADLRLRLARAQATNQELREQLSRVRP